MEGYMFLHFSYLHKSRHLINNKSKPQNSTFSSLPAKNPIKIICLISFLYL